MKGSKQEMVVVQKPSYSWWFDSHNSPRQSPWLVAALAELDGKTKQMLKLIEQDADSFAQRAEMYYKKRPELIYMVEDFYRTHRSMAEQFNHLKQEVRTHHTTPVGSPVSNKSWSLKSRDPMEKAPGTSSESSDSESEVDDPPEDVESEESGSSAKENQDSNGGRNEGGMEHVHQEMERLRDENMALKAQLREKDEEKREVIRQLCLGMDILKEEKAELNKIIKDCRKKGGMFDIRKLDWGRLLPWKKQTTVVAL